MEPFDHLVCASGFGCIWEVSKRVFAVFAFLHFHILIKIGRNFGHFDHFKGCKSYEFQKIIPQCESKIFSSGDASLVSAVRLGSGRKQWFAIYFNTWWFNCACTGVDWNGSDESRSWRSSFAGLRIWNLAVKVILTRREKRRWSSGVWGCRSEKGREMINYSVH